MHQPPSRHSDFNPLEFGPCACPRPDCRLKKKAPVDGLGLPARRRTGQRATESDSCEIEKYPPLAW
ncbi:hypothetical protein [Streptomyces clavuligerus]|uniref:Uncharacterized protein n=1 Tax=Streptomyces clavuligerus TaxID=1901 RepID=B5GQQ7_STRCL|nr:hypothetical protein [Streptomyces clavuligerus]AXU15010.1 hypothetical protein D1794_21140 [Streptomyces clavuligerus]EDY48653.1 hypothetical protein SSCG_01681 [Streptomyces clavuligerus]EFG06659.1 Hypothetical protein SCLAV_1584 [Streptomyces clavuligerus]QCS07784.1 hypothetical protein CRV15_20505 [Streptomyces clavuligerus]QPJ92873.1 hypothetical protein GE265_07580 [Streptomyces clavuligerus]